MKNLTPLDLPTLSADPAHPEAGYVRMYSRSLAGRCLPEWVDNSGEHSLSQPLLARARVALWQPPGSVTTLPGVFGMAVTTVGTATARAIADTNPLTRMKRIGYVSAATAGSLASWYVAAQQYTIGGGSNWGGFTLLVRYGASDAASVSGARMFIGMRNIAAAPTNVEPSTITYCIGLAKLSTSDNLHIVYGGSAAQTPIDLGVNFPANTGTYPGYELILYSRSSSSTTVYYRVERLGSGYIAEGTLTAATVGLQLPGTTTWLAPNFFRTNNATALAVGLDISSVYLETEY